jgi:CRISPR-associated protein (TIGR03985 family)
LFSNSSLEKENAIEQIALLEIANNYDRGINSIKRFSFYFDYIVTQENVDRVSDWQDLLKQIWATIPIGKPALSEIAPIEIKYKSSSLKKNISGVIYPVRIYYFQRAPYLCSFGEKPHDKIAIDWHNYRLDRIQNITQLTFRTCPPYGIIINPNNRQENFVIVLSQSPLLFQQLFHYL